MQWLRHKTEGEETNNAHKILLYCLENNIQFFQNIKYKQNFQVKLKRKCHMVRELDS